MKNDIKKVKILTLIGNNYGGTLQAYALYITLKKYIDNVSIINYTPFSNNTTLKDFIKKIIYIKRNIKFEQFRKKYIKLTPKVKDITDDENSIYVVGSDQVWNPSINYEIRKNFYLNFVKDYRRKNSYAASIGTDIIDKEKEKIDDIINMLSKFNYITVREHTANNLFKKALDREVYTVLDPTLLLTSKEWNNIIKEYKAKEKYICVYTLGLNKEFEKYIDEFSEVYNAKIIDVFYKKRFKKELKYENNFGPIEFVSAIANSDFVITNSFHGTVFAILYHKKFITITRGNMNSRVYDLLKKLGLEDRIISEEETNFNFEDIIHKDIDYKNIDDILITERNNSLKHLKKMLSIEESEK